MDFAKSITHWEVPDGAEFESQFGLGNYGFWCEKEAERMNKKGGQVRVKTDRKGLIAIVR